MVSDCPAGLTTVRAVSPPAPRGALSLAPGSHFLSDLVAPAETTPAFPWETHGLQPRGRVSPKNDVQTPAKRPAGDSAFILLAVGPSPYRHDVSRLGLQYGGIALEPLAESLDREISELAPPPAKANFEITPPTRLASSSSIDMLLL
jgi:hypothetical protein